MTSENTSRRSECEELLTVLYEYVDGSTDDRTRARLQDHVDRCPSCLEHLGIEQQVRQILRTRCTASAPSDLRRRIVSALRTETTVTTVETVRGADGETAQVTRRTTNRTAEVRHPGR
ncbi:mycothiol system anti-sigma-R factor [Corynebacterium bovis]|uniref:mycothiol system anti-sigma-R factor n=1 Tax=Corynebacterium bovis TaxID=36808 RepID=UPI003139F1A9